MLFSYSYPNTPVWTGDAKWTFPWTWFISVVECIYKKAEPVTEEGEGKTMTGEKKQKKILRGNSQVELTIYFFNIF